MATSATSSPTTSAINPWNFLRDPRAFVTNNPGLKNQTKALWSTIASGLGTGARAIEASTFGSTSIGSNQQYINAKSDLLTMYGEVERRIGNSDEATRAMEVKNWRTTSTLPEEDFSEEVRQFNESINQISSLGTTLQMPLAAMWPCQLYVGIAELAGKKIKTAAKYHTNNLTTMSKLGVAIDLLKNKGYTSMASFDSHLRNGIAHGNYIVSTNGIDYVDFPSSGPPFFGSATGQDLVRLGAGAMFFLWAALVINSDRYVTLINDAIAMVP